MNYARQYPRFWLSYFVFSVAMLLINSVHEAFANFGSIGASSLVGTVLAVVGLRPLYGYVRQRRYDPRWLWKVLLYVSVVNADAIQPAYRHVAHLQCRCRRSAHTLVAC
jgi:hypothetical protein